MNTKFEFISMMENQTEIALATSVNDVPNVRIVNFYFNPEINKLFFCTFKDNNKIKEFEHNTNVAFTTIPKDCFQHVRANGVVKKSECSIYDISDNFTNKYPSFKNLISNYGDNMVLFEIKLDEAIVTLDFEKSEMIKLNS